MDGTDSYYSYVDKGGEEEGDGDTELLRTPGSREASLAY